MCTKKLGLIFIIRAYTVPMFGFVIMSKNKKRILFIFPPIILLAAGTLTYYHFSRNTSDFHYFEEMNHVRSIFLDTKAGDYHEKTNEALSLVNWTEEDYKLGIILK